MSEVFDFKNYQWRKMANNGEKWRKMAMANLPFPFVKFAISPLAPPPPAFNKLGLRWSLVNEITRSRMVQGVLQKSLLDQVLYTNDALVSDVKLLSNLGKSDHMLLKIELDISLKKPTKEVETVVKKPAWSKVEQSDILSFSLENINWNYCHEDLGNMLGGRSSAEHIAKI